jgi:hypothetical protein
MYPLPCGEPLFWKPQEEIRLTYKQNELAVSGLMRLENGIIILAAAFHLIHG